MVLFLPALWALISTFVLAIAPSVAAQILLSLGIGIVSYAALSTLADNMVSSIHTQYDSIGGVAIQLLNLSGFGTGVNIICAALIAKAAMMAMKQMRPL